MKRILVLFIAGVVALTLLGCGSGSSKTESTSSSTNTKGDDKNNQINTGTTVNEKNPDVNVKESTTDLAKDWPAEIPLADGTITYSASANEIGADSKPTGEKTFTTSIETKVGNKAVYDYYKGKLGKVTKEGWADDKSAYLAGIIGKWDVSISSAPKDGEKDVYTVTIGVQPSR
jgi:hypothetical protein